MKFCWNQTWVKHTSWNFLSIWKKRHTLMFNIQSLRPHRAFMEAQRDSSPKNENSFIIYSPSFQTVWLFSVKHKRRYFIECWQSNSFGDHWQIGTKKMMTEFFGVNYPTIHRWKLHHKPSWFYHKPWANNIRPPYLLIWPILMNNNVSYFCVQILANNKKGHLHAEILMVQQKSSIFTVNIL